MSGLVAAGPPDAPIGLSLPVEEPDDQSRPGPFQTVLRQSKLILCAFTLHSSFEGAMPPQ